MRYINRGNEHDLDPDIFAFYQNALHVLKASGLPFMVGGAFALRCYTGIIRHTKDLDVFVCENDCLAILESLGGAGYRTELTDPLWLAKAFCGEDYVDVIFGSGKAICRVDEEWFVHAMEAEVLNVPVRLIPIEEMIWSKAFVMERERYDGADIAHLFHARARSLDWQRLLRRFGAHWRVLLQYLILFGYIYPGERQMIPDWVMRQLLDQLREELVEPGPTSKVCQGTLLSHKQFLIDIEQWGYEDPRSGTMTIGKESELTIQEKAQDALPSIGV